MMAIHLKMTELCYDLVDIILADHIKDYQLLVSKISDIRIFRRSYVMKAYDLDYRKGKFSGGKFFYFKNILFRKAILNKLVILEEIYDEFFATDILESTNFIYDYLFKKNMELKMVFYEEGPISVISEQNMQFVDKVYSNDKKMKRVLYHLCGYRSIYGRYSYGYSSISALAKKDFYFPMIDIPSPDPNDDYTKILNNIWGYDQKNAFPQRIIFFEESFALNDIECNDLKIVNDLVMRYGRENIIIKLHPRSRINRFEKLGVLTNKDSTIPWELIAMNSICENNILVAISTGSLIHPQLYWRIPQTSICLADCLEYRFDFLRKDYYQLFINICRDRKLAYTPKSKAELFELLDKIYIERGKYGNIQNQKVNN